MKDKSLCWTCKFGLCVRQSEKAVLISGGEEPSEPADSWQDEKPKSPPGQAEIHSEGYVSLCYWRPTFLNIGKDTPVHPVQFEEVHECNRYEKLSLPKKPLTGDETEV